MLRPDLRHRAERTSGEGFTNRTAALNRELAASGLKRGFAQLGVLHTSCLPRIGDTTRSRDPRTGLAAVAVD